MPAIPASALMELEYNTLGNYLLVPVLPILNGASATKLEFVLKGPQGEIQRSEGEFEAWPTQPQVDGVRFPLGALTLPSEEGSFSIDIEADGSVITSLPFTMKPLRGNGRTLPAQPVHMRDGRWRTHAYFSSLVDYPDLALYFNWWTGLHESDAPGPLQTSITVLRAGKVVARTDKPQWGWVERKDWSFNRKPLSKPDGSVFRAADLFSQDGEVEFVVKHNSAEFNMDKRVKSYFATIRGGQFVPPAEMASDHEPASAHLTSISANVRPSSLPRDFPYVRTWWAMTKK